MMDWRQMLMSRERVVFAIVGLLVAVGIASWSSMPRQEDPSFVDRFATVVVPWPGADATRVERLVVEPIEDSLAEVVELDRVQSTARAGVAVLQLRLDESIYDTVAAWDEVREALSEAQEELPSSAGRVRLDDGIGDPESVVVFVTGSPDLLELRETARLTRKSLLAVDGVANVKWLADPGQRIAVRLPPETSRRIGLSPRGLAAELESRHSSIPGGTLVVDGRSVLVDPRGELEDVRELERTPIRMSDGTAVPLGAIAEVTLEPEEPARSRLIHDGRAAVGLSVVAQDGVDLVALGERILPVLDAERAAHAPLALEVFSFQPEQVRSRINDLGTSLAFGVLIVAGVLFLAMGPRLGFVVASVVPLVAFSTVAVYAMGGGVLHQISIAALVLALGLLVDNAIVVAESVQQNLDRGLPPREAASEAVGELAWPLLTATGTTVAAFAPMLLSRGGTADFTRAIPVVMVLALGLSYLFALVVTPALSARFLRPGSAAGEPGRLARVAGWMSHVSVTRSWLVVGGLAALLLGTLGASQLVASEFFPLSDRSNVVVTLQLPEGTHLSATQRLAESFADDVGALEGTGPVTAFIGRGPPRFYYNLNDIPSAPHSATLITEVGSVDEVDETLSSVRELAKGYPEASIVVSRLQQGPPVGAPVEVKIRGNDLSDLQASADAVMALIRDVPGVRDVRSDMGLGMPVLALHVDDAVASRRGLSRAAVASSVYGTTTGMGAGQWRGSSEPVNLAVTGPRGERTSPNELLTSDVYGAAGPTPLADVAVAELSWTPASIQRVNRSRQVLVKAELEPGYTFGAVVAAAGPSLDALRLPDGVDVVWGGEAEGSQEANAALLTTLPVGVGMLLFFLLIQFNSFRRVAIVLLTVPLAAVGVIPGLVLSGQPFGFMSMLGVVSLVGIVVNNAIVLLEVVERRRGEGASVDVALSDAVAARIRPILLTTATTVAGMLPLAFSSSSLWPPLAWAMISGLLVSTGLTLVAVPAVYKLLLGGVRVPRIPVGPMVAAAAMLVTVPASGAEMSLAEVLVAAEESPASEAALRTAEAAAWRGREAWLGGLAPSFGVSAESVTREEAIAVDTPFGPIQQQPADQVQAGAEATLPLVAPGAWGQAVAASAAAKASHHDAQWERQNQVAAAGEAFLDVVALEASIDAQRAFVESLKTVATSVEERSDAGLVVPTDSLRATVALADAEMDLLRATRRLAVAQKAVGALIGSDEPVEARWEPWERAEGQGTRADLEAFAARERALKSQRAAVLAAGLPEVSAYGALRWTDNDALVENQWLEAGVRLEWVPLARGTRWARVGSVSKELAAVRAGREATRLGAEVEREQAEAAIAIAEREVEVRKLAVDASESAQRIVDERYRAGLANFTDWLAVEADTRAQRARASLAEVEVQRAWLRHDLAMGLL